MSLLPWFITDLVRDAVVHADPGDLKALKNIYGCVFDEDLQ
jgi:hypothetical protein